MFTNRPYMTIHAFDLRYVRLTLRWLLTVLLAVNSAIIACTGDQAPGDVVELDYSSTDIGLTGDSFIDTSTYKDTGYIRDDGDVKDPGHNVSPDTQSSHDDTTALDDGVSDTSSSEDVPTDLEIKACCANGACYDWPGDECTKYGGIKHSGKTCNDNPCNLSACIANGFCRDQISKDNCEKVLVGTWKSGLKCSDGILMTSACCAHGRCLENLSKETCEGDAGVWHLGTTCEQNPCRFGACCGPMVDGQVAGCVDEVTNQQCSNFGGIWREGYDCSDEIDDVDVCAGACCVNDQWGGYCQDEKTADQCSGTGSFVLGKSCSGQPCPRQMWSCCTQIGCRDYWSEERCETDGVSTWHYKKTCSDDPCSQAETEHVCCVEDQFDVGCYSDYSETWCVDWQDGTYLKNSSCSTNPCGFEYGACCNTNEMTCTDFQTATQCQGDGLVWHKNAECDDNPCGIYYGACCYTLFSFPQCSDNDKQTDCVGTGVTFHRDEKCEDNPCHWEDIYETGACCFPSISTCRDDVLAPDCDGDAQEPEFHANVKCSSKPCAFKTGACCETDGNEGSCEDNVFSTDCSWHDQVFVEDAICSTNPCGLGACYSDTTGYCFDNYTESGCRYDTYTWEQGRNCDDITFKETGACILPDSTCEVLSSESCDSREGTWLVGVDCFKMNPDPSWACCADGCTHSAMAGCKDGGTTWREGLYCVHNPCHLWACCGDNGCSDNTSQSACSAKGGFWHDGQVCANSPCQGACCTNKACDESKTEDVCVNGSGTWHEGLSCWDLPCK